MPGYSRVAREAGIAGADVFGGRREMNRLADWLAEHQVSHVVMEATGQYWKLVWDVLAKKGFELMMVNALRVKMVPGRKTDVADATWLAELLEHGLPRGSFVPPRLIRELRDLTRYQQTAGPRTHQ